LAFFRNPAEQQPFEQGDCFASLRSARNDVSVLDLCTGSGCIAICLAKHINCAKIIAADISKKSIEAARKNARINGVVDKIEFRMSDLFENVGLGQRFDVIVSNPPYIKRSDLNSLPEEVRREPIVALNGGKDGLHFYRKIVQAGPAYLKEGGFLAMELGDGQSEKVKDTVEANSFFKDIEIVRDLNGVERVLIAQMNEGL